MLKNRVLLCTFVISMSLIVVPNNLILLTEDEKKLQ